MSSSRTSRTLLTPPVPLEDKHRSAGSVTLVHAGDSPNSSTESFKSASEYDPNIHVPPSDAGEDITDARSIISETHIDPILRSSAFTSVDDIEKAEAQYGSFQGAGRDPHAQAWNEKADTSAGDFSPPDPNLVSFDGDNDPLDPQNHPFHRKCLHTFILAGLTFSTTFTSSIFSTSVVITSEMFSLSEVVMTLGTSLFLLGFCTGPIIWGPISELYGRKPPLLLGVGGMSLFQVGVAVSQNAYTIFICRFFGGVFGVAPLCVVGGALADFWDPVQRGVAVGVYSMCTFVGPVAAPILGGYVTESHLGWRFTHHISYIMSLTFFFTALCFLPETSHSRLLQFRARDMKHEASNWAIHAPADEKRLTFKVIVERYLTRPGRMVRQEPILMWLCTYIGLTYGILYLFLTAYPYSFETERHWSQGKAGLPFLAISIGVIAGGIINSYWSVTQFRKRLEAANDAQNTAGGAITPESRLPPMILGGLLLPPGLFWWGWTSFPSITPWPQIIAGVPMGAGILLILVNGLNYIVDVYKQNSNSAIAANTVIRCLFGAVFPMFAQQMYKGLGTRWATSVLGFAALVCSAGPVIFWLFGERIRRRSRFVLES